MEPGELTAYALHGMQPVLGVPDVLETVGFYRDALGFHVDFVEGDPPVHARVVADPTYSAPTVHVRFEPLAAGASPNPTVELWLHVAHGPDRLFEAYRGRGVTVQLEPVDRPWSLRQFAVEDCNGYVLDFCAEIPGGG
jgi:catechol 2,3-dioxygenase-like lactoylglutathione lyase family enzyme